MNTSIRRSSQRR